MAERTGVPDSPESCLSVDHGGWTEVRKQDLFLPIASISRIMRKAIPENGRISKDAKEFMQECVFEFICFVTSEASHNCLRERRKAINGDDLVRALRTLGFNEYVEPLVHYMQLYREGKSKGSRSADQSGKSFGEINGDPGASDNGM